MRKPEMKGPRLKGAAAKMSQGYDPERWLVLADMLEEQGHPDSGVWRRLGEIGVFLEKMKERTVKDPWMCMHLRSDVVLEARRTKHRIKIRIRMINQTDHRECGLLGLHTQDRTKRFWVFYLAWAGENHPVRT